MDKQFIPLVMAIESTFLSIWNKTWAVANYFGGRNNDYPRLLADEPVSFARFAKQLYPEDKSRVLEKLQASQLPSHSGDPN